MMSYILLRIKIYLTTQKGRLHWRKDSNLFINGGAKRPSVDLHRAVSGGDLLDTVLELSRLNTT
jgi:hypothetical protein